MSQNQNNLVTKFSSFNLAPQAGAVEGHLTRPNEEKNAKYETALFVDEVNVSEFGCGVCHFVVTNVVEANCCGSMFCEECISRRLRMAQQCPKCSKSITRENIGTGSYLQRTVRNLVVKCPSTRSGCKWQGRLSAVGDHESECGFTYVNCPKCGWRVQRKEFVAHTKCCPKGLVVCEDCSQKTERGQMDKHMAVCFGVMIVCPNDCGIKCFERRLLSQHLLNTCVLANVSCPFCKNQLHRKELVAHKEKCPKRNVQCEYCSTMVQHLDLSSHHNHCARFPEECPNNCGIEKMPRFEQRKHVLEKCPKQKIPCHYCFGKFLREKLEWHRVSECPKRPISCEFCKTLLSAPDYKRHLLNCPQYMVVCPNNCGVVQEISRKELTVHLKSCPLQIVSCNFCTSTMERRVLLEHKTSECKMREVPCGSCNEQVVLLKMKIHLKACSHVKIDCELGCGVEKFRRKDLRTHCLECSMVPVDCPFAEFGCKAKVARRTLAEHMNDVNGHLLAVCQRLKNVEKEMEEMKSAVQDKEAIEQLEDRINQVEQTQKSNERHSNRPWKNYKGQKYNNYNRNQGSSHQSHRHQQNFQNAHQQGARSQGPHSQGARSQGPHSQGARSQGPHSQGPQPQVAQPHVAQPQVAQPQVAQPQAAQPQVAQPQVAQSQVAQPQVAQHQVAQPQVAQPQVAQPPAAPPHVAHPPQWAQNPQQPYYRQYAVQPLGPQAQLVQQQQQQRFAQYTVPSSPAIHSQNPNYGAPLQPGVSPRVGMNTGRGGKGKGYYNQAGGGMNRQFQNKNKKYQNQNQKRKYQNQNSKSGGYVNQSHVQHRAGASSVSSSANSAPGGIAVARSGEAGSAAYSTSPSLTPMNPTVAGSSSSTVSGQVSAFGAGSGASPEPGTRSGESDIYRELDEDKWEIEEEGEGSTTSGGNPQTAIVGTALEFEKGGQWHLGKVTSITDKDNIFIIADSSQHSAWIHRGDSKRLRHARQNDGTSAWTQLVEKDPYVQKDQYLDGTQWSMSKLKKHLSVVNQSFLNYSQNQSEGSLNHPPPYKCCNRYFVSFGALAQHKSDSHNRK